MKYYIEQDGEVWAFEDNYSGERLTETMRAMTDEEIYLHLNPPPTAEDLAFIEAEWVAQQSAEIAEQLLMIEDRDTDAKPGTVQQWRDYRIELRKWKEGGNANFPDNSKRPVAPS